MKFKETPLKGAYIVELEPIKDKRGFFARSFCREEFRKYGLDYCVAQCNISYNKDKGVLRGMHYQISPYQEAKLVSCVSGRIYDVIIDLREDSCTYRKWFALELSQPSSQESCSQMLYVPKNFAHGFWVLENNTVVLYQMSQSYHPECAQGIRWNDPAFDIIWPGLEPIISEKDNSYPDFKL